jgi:hypothetical protein
MHEPWRHRSGLDPYASVIPRMPAHQNADLFWNCGHWPRHSLRPALSTTQIAVIFCETSTHSIRQRSMRYSTTASSAKSSLSAATKSGVSCRSCWPGKRGNGSSTMTRLVPGHVRRWPGFWRSRTLPYGFGADALHLNGQIGTNRERYAQAVDYLIRNNIYFLGYLTTTRCGSTRRVPARRGRGTLKR